MTALTLNLKLRTRNSRRPRRAVTIIEVLFAILVTSVGILGAIAMFPVASAQARRARLNDTLGNAGRSAFHNFDTRGMRRPDRWLAWDPYAGMFASYLSATNLTTGESLCIDPRMIAAHTTTSPPPAPGAAGMQVMTAGSASGFAGGQCVQSFPYAAPGTSPFLIPPTPTTSARWNTQYMRRITLWDGINRPTVTTPATSSGTIKWGLTLPAANAIFQIDDDISYTRPDNGSNANGTSTRADSATQSASILSSISDYTWGRRMTEGKISWLATLVPVFDVSGAPSDQYTLSVVMLYDRPNHLGQLDTQMERTVKAAFIGTGATGGEAYLTAPTLDELQVRANDWVLVHGLYMPPATPNSPAGTPMTRFQWYRITECDPEPTLNSSGSAYELYVSLMGQDWNTNFLDATAIPATTGAGLTPVRLTIVEGAFAVYEKTIRMEYGSTF